MIQSRKAETSVSAADPGREKEGCAKNYGIRGMSILRVEAIPVRVPLREEILCVDAHGAGTKHFSEYVLVKVFTSEGIMGLGEATVHELWSGETQIAAKHCIDHILAPCLIGQDALNVEFLTGKMANALIGNPFAKAALEMALYDIVGKALGVPVYTLLGGRLIEKVRLKASVSASPPDRATNIAQFLISQGFSMLKIKVGISPASDIERVKAVREVVGPNVELGVDANGGWNPQQARSMIPRLEELGVRFIEQPVGPENVHWMAGIKRISRIPIVADESVFSLSDALTVVEHDAADVLSIYPGKNAGIGVSKKIAGLAQAAKYSCLVGSNLELGIGSAANLHLACSTHAIEAEVYPCDIIGPIYHATDVVKEPIRIESGYALVSDRPGLGVELDEDKVSRLRVG